MESAFMMTAFASTETAVETMRLGAVDYFTKPFSMDELRLKIRQHLETTRLKEENVLLKRALNTRHEFSNIIGRSDPMLAVFRMIETVAGTSSTVLVTGESRFDELPGVMARLAAGSLPALCHTITYDGA